MHAFCACVYCPSSKQKNEKRPDSEAVHRVFLILRRWSHQKEALDAAAEGKLSNDEMNVYRALIAEYRSLEAQRNKLAHGCFGVCPDDEDLLFVISVNHHVLWQADILPKHLKGNIRVDSHEGLKQHMYVYRISDLQSLYCQMEQLWWDMFYFNVSNTRDCGIQQLLPIDCYPLC
jgi:hypothetical protein